LIESRRFHEQADDHIGFTQEVEKVPWVDQDIVSLEQFDDERLFGSQLRHLNDRRPAAFDSQYVDLGM
jgi:hypothetical protein